MVLGGNLHDEWRSPELALALDVSLVEHVFRTLARRRRGANSTCKCADSNQRTSIALNAPRYDQQPHEDSQRQSSNSDSSDTNREGEQPAVLLPAPSAPAPYFHPEMRFAKSNVLVTLERAEGFLQKRPLLRMLHTNLACVSLEKEGESLEGFVRFRVKERTLSFAMARDRLLQIHDKTQRALEFAQRTEEFNTQARAKSLWCVRDWMNIYRSPAQHYGVHVLPPKPKSQKQLDMERHVLETIARDVVNNALALSIEKIVTALEVRSHPSTGRRSARSRTPGAASEVDSALRKPWTRSDPLLRAKARRSREHAAAESRRTELRLQIFAPGIEQNARLASAASVSEAPLSSSAVVDNNSVDGGDRENESEGDALESCHANQSRTKLESLRVRQHQLLLLATVEANGDAYIAERIAAQKIARSGFQRAIEQAANLGLAHDDDWGLIKTWRAVYRSHTLQSLQTVLGRAHT